MGKHINKYSKKKKTTTKTITNDWLHMVQILNPLNYANHVYQQ